MHRIDKAALWRSILTGLSALGVGFGAIAPVYIATPPVSDHPAADQPQGEWDWSIPYQWFDHAHE
ncbi:MAG: hypothetical protein J2P18_05925 [Nocardia sp.]|nr:hypothetical protein [Nocardia sp.]